MESDRSEYGYHLRLLDHLPAPAYGSGFQTSEQQELEQEKQKFSKNARTVGECYY